MKKLLLAMGITAASLLLTGCSPKVSVVKKNMMLHGEKETIYLIQGKESWRSPSGSYNVATRNRHMLLNAAKATLHEDKKYFAIYSPEPISNVKGSLVNTPEEYMDACMPSGANLTVVGNELCGFHTSKMRQGILILMYSEKPHEYPTYDAQAVIDYMKKNDYDREDTWDEFVDKTQ